MQKQLRDYIVTIKDELPYVTATLISVTYVDTPPDADKKINYPHFYGELIYFGVISIAKCKYNRNI